MQEMLESRLERSRAVLESKEQIIASLEKAKSATADRSMESGQVDGSGLVESLKVQVSDLKDANEELRQDLFDQESRFTKVRDNLTGQWEAATKEMNLQISQKKAVESEVRGLRTELRAAKDEAQQLKGEAHKLEAELGKTKLMLKRRDEVSASQNESEIRLKKLTEALLSKQSALDLAQNEKAALILQLESVKRNLKETNFEEAFLRNSAQQSQMGGNDRREELVPLSSGVVPQNLFGFANVVDGIWISLISRIRRIPNLRLFVIFYLMVMQLIMIVFILHYRWAKHK